MSTPSTPSLLVAGAQHPKTSLYAGFLNGVTHWQQVQDKIQALPTSQEKGDSFEAIMAALIVTDPAKQIRQAWFPAGQAPADLWKRLGLPSSQEDRGIDGLAIDANGNTIAIQFKFRSGTGQTLNWSNDKLGNFFGMSNRVNVAWLVSNVDTIQDLGQRHEHALTMLLPDLQKMSAARFADAAAWMQGQAVTFQRKMERTDQTRALDAIDRAFRGEVVETFASDEDLPSLDQDLNHADDDQDLDANDDGLEDVPHVLNTAVAHNRVTVVSACGTGKTLIAERAVERSIERGGRRFVVFVPSIALIDQTVEAWTREWAGDPALKARMRYLAVCSDETVGDTQDDRTIMRVNELNIPSVTTHAGDLHRFLEAPAGPDDVRVVFATYQSSEVVQEAVTALQAVEPGWTFDLGVLDEAHKTAIRATGTSAKHQMFSRPLHDEAIPIRQRVAMTATPRVRRVAAKDGDEATVVHSMDNVDLYGPIVHRYTFHDAVQDGVIVPYKVVVSMVRHDDAQAARVTVRGQDGQERQLSLDEAANRLAVAKAIQITGAQRVLTFHSTIKDAEGFAGMATDAGVGGVLEQLGHDEQDVFLQGWNAQSIKGVDSAARRDTILQGLRDHGKSLRSNVRVLIEGLDVPAVDMVAFLGRQASPTDIVQAVGRAARSYEGKQEGYVVVPVIYGQDQNLDEALATAQDRDDGMGTLFTLLSALMDHDQDLTRVINDLQTARVSGNPDAIEKATRAFGQRVGVIDRRSSKGAMQFTDPLDMGLHDLSEKLSQRVVERLADWFAVGLGHLDRFIEEHQHANVPAKYPKDQRFPLGSWLVSRRMEHKSGRLSEERIAALNARNISWEPKDDQFSAGLLALDQFIEEHQHADVPRDHPKIQGISLGSWLTSRRQEYKKGRLHENRIAALNARNISWEPQDDLFSAGLQALDQFIVEHQHADVPRDHPKIQGISLGSWLDKRRHEYKKGRLPEDLIAALNARNISWESKDDLFSAGLQALDLFIVEHQHADVPRDHPKIQGISLGNWLGNRRQDYKKGRLPKDRIAALNARNISWEPKDDLFSRGLQALDRFIEEHQHANIQQKYQDSEGFPLGSWLSDRRQDYKNGRLPEDRIAVLNTRKISWEPKDDLFSAGIHALDQFIEQHQHANVPRDHPKIQGISLGQWLTNRRQEYKKGRLSEERIAALNARDPFWTTGRRGKASIVAVGPPTEGTFLQYLAPLATYHAVHGGLNVPDDHRTDDGLMLGAWLRQQCLAMRAGTLPDQEKAVLVAMGVHADLFKPLEPAVVDSATPCVVPPDEFDELMDVARTPVKPRRRLGT